MENKKIIFIILGIGALILALGLLSVFLRAESVQTTLTVWGPLEESEAGWEKIAKNYEKENPSVTLVYKRVPFDEYQSDLIDAFATESAPDIFYVHNTWLPVFRDLLEPMPNGSAWMNFTEYRKTFVDAVVSDFTRDESTIYAVPLFMETLALYYNVDMLSSVGMIQPPESWDEFKIAVERLTIRDANNRIIQIGATLGTSENVNVGTDILMLMMLQYFDNELITNPETGQVRMAVSDGESGAKISPAVAAINLYTSFSNESSAQYTWNTDQWYSIDAFIGGKAAMMLNYPHHIATVKSRAPQLDFAISRAPQLKKLLDARKAIDYPSYWGLGVNALNKTDKNTVAWEFIRWMGEREQQEDSYIRYTKDPLRLSPRRDLIDTLINDPAYGVFARQALTAGTWFQPNSTEIRIILDDLIEDIVAGVKPRDAILDARGEITELMLDYVDKQKST